MGIAPITIAGAGPKFLIGTIFYIKLISIAILYKKSKTRNSSPEQKRK